MHSPVQAHEVNTAILSPGNQTLGILPIPRFKLKLPISWVQDLSFWVDKLLGQNPERVEEVIITKSKKPLANVFLGDGHVPDAPKGFLVMVIHAANSQVG